MEEKHYCKNCKYCYFKGGYSWHPCCHYEEQTMGIYSPYNGRQVIIPEGIIKNDNGECPFYEAGENIENIKYRNMFKQPKRRKLKQFIDRIT